jgi:hypothetical protein
MRWDKEENRIYLENTAALAICFILALIFWVNFLYIRNIKIKTSLNFKANFEKPKIASSFLLMNKISPFFKYKGIPSTLRIENRKELCVIEPFLKVCYILLWL